MGLKNLLPGFETLSRQARIVIVYHTIAIPFISLLAILILNTLKIENRLKDRSCSALTFGSIMSSLSGLIFAYFSGGVVLHGLFVTGLAIVFYGGLQFFYVVLNPKTEGFGLNIERISLAVLVASVLVSAGIGAYIGSHFGSGFKAILAEDIIRRSHNLLERALISHLHIMVALVAASVLLLLTRQFEYYKQKIKSFYYLFLIGVLVTSFSTWAVVIKSLEKQAHKIINIGAVLLIFASFVYAFHVLKKYLTKRQSNEFEMLSVYHLFLVNLSVTAPGVYVATNLHYFRSDKAISIERAFAVGHWHILSATCALILLAIFFV